MEHVSRYQMRKEYSAPYIEPVPADPAVVTSKHGGGLLLVVDDDSSSRDLITHRLKGQGHVALGAAGGSQAMEMVRAASFHLILLDIMMTTSSSSWWRRSWGA